MVTVLKTEATPPSAPPARPTWRRAQFWIDPDTQWRIIRAFLILNAVLVSVLYGVDQLFFYRLRAVGQGVGLPQEHPYFLFLQEQQSMKFYAFLATAGLISIGLSAFALFFSHRIAGPIFKLRRTLQSVSAGHAFEPIAFRKNDFFKNLDQDLNGAVLRLQERPTPVTSDSQEKKAC